jgi:hypothetical protein
MGKFQDLTGQVFGRLTVVSLSEKTNARKEFYWECICECGGKRISLGRSLRTGKNKSCGCFHSPDLTNKRFGKLAVVGLSDTQIEGKDRQWNCICDCGQQIIVTTHKLLANKTQSCGCNGERVCEKHGLSHLPEYKIWVGMKIRCKLEPDYVANGITVCPEWQSSFEQFLADVGRRPSPKHQLDRRNSLGNYDPLNTRWLEGKENGWNKTNNRLIEFQGETKCLTEWAEFMGIKSDTLFGRLNKGWSIEKALTTPVGKRSPNKNPRQSKQNLPEYKIWKSIKYRCKSRYNYVNNGIELYAEWSESFEAFYQYLKETIGLRPSAEFQLDRADNTKGYVPTNLRWLTQKQNQRNKSSNRFITHKGVTQTVADWSDQTGIPQSALLYRLKHWSTEEALEHPLDPNKSKPKKKQI